jgi:catechol 2,3-dioxygenase-like lactoylglutathione lyase family enzyme
MSLALHINRLQHIGLPVTSLEASKSFYTTLGFTEVIASTFPHPEGTGHVCMMQLNGILLELYEMPAAALQEIRDRRSGHIDHIAFDVSDIDATFAALNTADHTLCEPAPVFLPFWKNGCKYFNILGPDGERLEFNQIL